MLVYIFWVVVFCVLWIQNANACRFWLAVADKVPEESAQYALTQAPHSLKQLSSDYRDGWSIGYYYDGTGIVLRGDQPAFEDKEFETMAHDISAMQRPMVFAHIRRASSGCVSGVPNPHPFERYANEKFWLLGHNGDVSKNLLISLIGQDYLDSHPPGVCGNLGPEGWIDSELLMIYFLKMIELNDWDTGAGLVEALTELYKALPDERRFLNFFLTDGTTVWVFRKGNTLFYRYDETSGLTEVSSTIPGDDASLWQEFPEDMIGVIQPHEDVRFIALSRFWPRNLPMN